MTSTTATCAITGRDLPTRSHRKWPDWAERIEPNGESATNVLAPYNLDTQDVRTRFWDGQDNMIRDDLSWSKGTHFFQFGGIYQHNWNYHQRTDNGGGINYQDGLLARG